MDRVFKVPAFNKWMKKAGLTDRALCHAIDEMKSGLIDADLGGSVLKKRVALPGRGKRGSSRTLVAANKKGRWIFLFGFQKNERGNISSQELDALRELSSDLLGFSNLELTSAIFSKALLEVNYETKK